MLPTWIMLTAAALGGRHALAPDHLAAVGTYVEKTRANRRQGVGFALRIAAGHSAGMLAIAGIVEGLMMTLNPAWLQATTWASGLWLMVMAAWILWDLVRDLRPVSAAYAAETSDDSERLSEVSTRPRTVFRRKIRLQGDWVRRPHTAWLVGLLFGLAVAPGDLAIFTMMVPYHSQPLAAFGLLGIFLLTMFAGLSIVGAGLGWANGRAMLRRGFQAFSGVAGMGVSLALITGVLH